jgi:uncharacterized membrane protein
MKNVIAASMTVAALTFSIALLARAEVGSASLFSASGTMEKVHGVAMK